MLSYEDMQRGRPNRRSELDRVARGAANRLRQTQQPWAVFTAGFMGAGKTCARRHHSFPVADGVSASCRRHKTTVVAPTTTSMRHSTANPRRPHAGAL